MDFFKTWGPYIIFGIGYFLNWRKGQIDKRDQDRTYKSLVVQWISLAKERTSSLSKNCTQFCKDLQKSEFIDSVTFSSIPMMYNRLNSIDTDKLIRAFVFNSTGTEDENLKNFNNLIANVNFLTKVEDELKEKYDKSYSAVQIINDTFNTTLISLEKIFFEKVNEVSDNRNHQEYRYIRTINDIRENWYKNIKHKDEGSTVTFTFDKLIFPLLDYVSGVFNQNKSSSFLLKTYEELHNMQIVKRQWDAYKEGTGLLFDTYALRIKTSYEELETSIKYFQDETDLVSFWKIK